MATMCLVMATVDRRAATCFQRAVNFLVNDMANFENDIIPSEGGNMFFEGGLVPNEIVILASGYNTFSEAGFILQRVAEPRTS